MIDLSTLNPQQREAVTWEGKRLLVLAGAGSGKTRVISYRIAHLIGERGVDPSTILAVTFTNKAASEMVSRVQRLVMSGRPTVGTFHSTSLRMLRKYATKLGYTSSFAVYDTADQMTLVRRCARELQMSDEVFPPRKMLSRISAAKNELIGPAQFEKDNVDFIGAKVAQIYRLYQTRLKEFDAMDFDDLIGKYYELLEHHADVREEVRRRFQHLLIDEYQDTNKAQYLLIRALAGETGSITAVGDEDQSIYKFRGADINNILNFERDFPGAKIIKLEQNYRSTGNILDAATGVVSQNVKRKGKKLFTDAGEGEPVRVVTCESEREEAQFVINRINEMRPAKKLTDFAVLFRTNAQSRPFEDELRRENMPYIVVGGVKFYERAEVKDVMSYLRLSVRPHDTPSIERVINVPARGIGSTTMKALEEESRGQGVPLWNVIDGDLPFLPDRARKAIREFREIVLDLQKAASNPVPEFLEYVLIRTGYRRMYAGSKDPQDESRLQNLDELINSAAEFQEANPEATLADYLDSVTLVSDVDRYDAEKGVTLMTLHMAKGLEFPVVFLVGLEEGILPHFQSQERPDDVEEERRLCYVGMTRAREVLYCIHCHQRRIHGQLREQSPSPFLEEIPESATEKVGGSRPRYRQQESRPSWRERPIPERRPSTPAPSRPASRPDPTTNVLSFFENSPVRFDPSAIQPASAKPQSGGAAELVRGSRVRHEQFGTGVILKIEGAGDSAKLSVYFDRVGTKKFVAKFAKLTRA